VLLVIAGCDTAVVGAEIEKQKAIEKRKQAEVEMKRAHEAAEEAARSAAEAEQNVQRIQKDLDDLDARVATAVDSVVAAQTEGDRAAAKAKLEALRLEKVDLERRIAEAKAAAARQKRLQGSRISKECQDNPLAKGCM
jgi:predicted  nucleic acid-binding Zn-ribbon protein